MPQQALRRENRLVGRLREHHRLARVEDFYRRVSRRGQPLASGANRPVKTAKQVAVNGQPLGRHHLRVRLENRAVCGDAAEHGVFDQRQRVALGRRRCVSSGVGIAQSRVGVWSVLASFSRARG